MWEYLAPFIYGDIDEVMKEITKLGNDRWELVHMFERSVVEGQRVVLKRHGYNLPHAAIDPLDLRPGAIHKTSS